VFERRLGKGGGLWTKGELEEQIGGSEGGMCFGMDLEGGYGLGTWSFGEFRSMGERVRTYRWKYRHFYFLYHFLSFLHFHHCLIHPSTSIFHHLFFFFFNT
jgi:hypothetical protein